METFLRSVRDPRDLEAFYGDLWECSSCQSFLGCLEGLSTWYWWEHSRGFWWAFENHRDFRSEGFLLGSQSTSLDICGCFLRLGCLEAGAGECLEQRADTRGAMRVCVGLWDSASDFVGEPRNLGFCSCVGHSLGIVGLGLRPLRSVGSLNIVEVCECTPEL